MLPQDGPKGRVVWMDKHGNEMVETISTSIEKRSADILTKTSSIPVSTTSTVLSTTLIPSTMTTVTKRPSLTLSQIEPTISTSSSPNAFHLGSGQLGDRVLGEYAHFLSEEENDALDYAHRLHNAKLSQQGLVSIDDRHRIALQMVADAQEKTGARKAYLLANPRFNSATGPKSDENNVDNNEATRKRMINGYVPPYSTNDTVRAAAAYLNDIEMTAAVKTVSRNSTLKTKRDGSSFWMEDPSFHNGQMPFARDPTYKVFRNVKDYGATGDGVTDDTAAINRAINDGNRCSVGCAATSVKGALVYFPSGTYMVSGNLSQTYYTQFVGNANNRPIVKATDKMTDSAIFSSDFYDGGPDSHEWFINQNNFYRQIRNFVIDVSAVPSTVNVSAIHWQVAQATSLQNILIIASTDANTTQQGIFMENGSGGFLSDIQFIGGREGFFAGNQQFTTRNLHVRYVPWQL